MTGNKRFDKAKQDHKETELKLRINATCLVEAKQEVLRHKLLVRLNTRLMSEMERGLNTQKTRAKIQAIRATLY